VEPTIRPATNDDCPEIKRVIMTVHDEYGFTWDAEGYHADLEDIEKAYLAPGGAFWVMELAGGVIATCGVKRRSQELCELYRLYLLSEYRGNGYGGLFFAHSVDWSRESGFGRMDIWSDVKLTDAHKLYEKRGAVYVGQRICDDPDNSVENGYYLNL